MRLKLLLIAIFAFLAPAAEAQTCGDISSCWVAEATDISPCACGRTTCCLRDSGCDDK